jgi:hypothetical protein
MNVAINKVIEKSNAGINNVIEESNKEPTACGSAKQNHPTSDK